MSSCERHLFILTVSVCLCAIAAADVTVTQTEGGAALSNGATQLSAKIQNGMSNGFDLMDARSNRVLARIEIGGNGRWAAACSAKSEGGAGHLTFKSIHTGATGGQPAFDPDSEIRVELRNGDPFPQISFRLKVKGINKEAWEKALGYKAPPTFLNCRMDAAQVFYRGGFDTPSPALDPFPIHSSSLRGEWDGDWACAVAMGACPIPAVGLWDPEASTFVGYEFQEARSSDKSSKHVTSVFCAGMPDEKRQFFALLVPQDETEGRFGLVYSTDLPSAASPNEFVIRHIWKTYGNSLPPVPQVNDLGWAPKRDVFLPDDTTDATLLYRIKKNSLDESSIFFLDNALLPCGGYRGTLNLFMEEKDARRKQAQEEWAALKAKAITKRIGADDCVFWRFPLEGEYEDWFGGEAAATTHSPSTWKIGASLLAMYRSGKDPALLPYIDGIFRWTRHCVFTRGGDCGLPAASSVASVDGCCVEFLLNFYHLFRQDKDAKRRAMAEEGLALGRSVLYRSLAIYTGDPDETDNLDPTFLIQADNDRSSAGVVSWKGTGKLIRAMALYYVETGDPVLKYFVQGALQRWPLGIEADGLHTIECLDVFGVRPETKGQRAGLLDPDDSLAEYIQPIGSACLRVLCGRKQALAFDVGTKPRSVSDYSFEEDGNISFKIVGDPAYSFDINITSPLRDLRGKKVFVNGKDRQAEVVGRYGENIILRDVAVGDTITVGQVKAEPVTADQIPTFENAKIGDQWGEFSLVAVSCDKVLDSSWGNGLSWAGLVEGLHFAWGVPFQIVPGDKKAVDVSAGPFTILIGKRFASGLLFAAPSTKPPVVEISYADGKTEKHDLTLCLPALSSGPIRNWQIGMYPFQVNRPEAAVERVQVAGGGILFAFTTHPRTSPAFEEARTRYEAKRKAIEDEARAELELKRAEEQIVPDLRAKVAAATAGKILRIGFLPPHEAYTEILRTACSTLGAPPALLSPEEVIDPNRFSAERYPIVVYSSPETFVHTVKEEGDAAAAVKKYLADGGCLVAAAQGYPFYYATRLGNGKFEKIKDTRNAETCSDLEIFISGGMVPPLEAMPGYELTPRQQAFTHLPGAFRYDKSSGGGYRLLAGSGLPAEDVFKPFIVMKDGTGKEHGVVAAEIEHRCKRYNGGRVIFLWGNILAMESGPTIALDLMSYAICTTKLRPGAVREPQAAILPRDAAGHEKAVEHACSSAGLKARMLTPEEFVDPAVFNPRNFPIAIHAVQGEYYLSECAGRSNLWQIYADYVRGGGFLVACGNMAQFHYVGTLGGDGKWQQKPDAEQLVREALDLRVSSSRIRDSRPMFLKCLPGQDIIRWELPIPLEYLTWGRYRAVNAGELSDAEFVPIAEVVDERGNSFGDYVIAVMRYPAKAGQELKGAEMLWFWGDLLDDARAYPLLDQAMKYAYDRRKAMFHPAK